METFEHSYMMSLCLGMKRGSDWKTRYRLCSFQNLLMMKETTAFLNSQHGEAITLLKSQHSQSVEDAVKRANEGHNSTLQTATQQHAQAIQHLKDQHTKEVQEINVTHDKNLESSTSKNEEHSAAKDWYKARVKREEEIISLQSTQRNCSLQISLSSSWAQLETHSEITNPSAMTSLPSH